MKIAPILVVALLLSGCASAYKSSNVMESLERVSRHLNEYATKITDDCAQKEQIHATLVKSGAKADSEPYVGMRQDLAEMEPLAKKVRGQADEVQRMHLDVRAKLAGDRRVKSDDPMFKEIEAARTRIEAIGGEVEAAGKKYQQVSTRFIDRAKQHKIYEIDVAQLRGQVEQQVAALLANVKKTQGEFGMIRTRVDELARNPEKRAQAQQTVDQLAEILKVIEAQGAEADAISQDFTREVGGQAKLLVAPHMVCHTVLVRLQEKYAQINAEVAKFNAIASDLVKSLKK